MSQNEKQPIEKLLEQMSLQQPSQELDDAVFDLTRRQSPVKVDPAPTASFGWRSLAATALICASVGICIGRWIPQDHILDPEDSQSHLLTMDGATKTLASRSVDQSPPLSLRESAIAPLHGHAAQIIDEGFVLLDGKRPSQTYRVVKSRQQQRENTLPVREMVVLPSPEI
ncbi:hypothetical protein [Gimesia aquarii]|uniref:Uncharacterized protein n=1 Tax=Gimesia aquarii TaxID=2527964 RepID=A0A517W421_9PLAN|nr:hypothetical protein [Gimesia aquarii]QDU00002.1 hypothetical protein V144x_55150 [Gimesia aquarii]